MDKDRKTIGTVAGAILAGFIINGAGGLWFVSKWQGQTEERVTAVERRVSDNEGQVRLLIEALHANARETAVLAERMRGIIERMDRRRAEQER